MYNVYSVLAFTLYITYLAICTLSHAAIIGQLGLIFATFVAVPPLDVKTTIARDFDSIAT